MQFVHTWFQHIVGKPDFQKLYRFNATFFSGMSLVTFVIEKSNGLPKSNQEKVLDPKEYV